MDAHSVVEALDVSLMSRLCLVWSQSTISGNLVLILVFLVICQETCREFLRWSFITDGENHMIILHILLSTSDQWYMVAEMVSKPKKEATWKH